MTDQEVQLGILNRENAKNKSIVFFRNIENMPQYDESLNDYRDDDVYHQYLLEELKLKVKQKLTKENISYFQVCTYTTNHNSKQPEVDYDFY